MDLSQIQKETVQKWVEEEGLTPAEVQKKIKEEFSLSFTYMETFLLLDELDCKLKERERGPDKLLKTTPEQAVDSSFSSTDEDTGGLQDTSITPEQLGHKEASDVRVTIDKVTRPGAAISGSVTFTNGVTTQWHIDAMHHQLAIIPPKGSAQPSNDELAKFQIALQQELRRHGY